MNPKKILFIVLLVILLGVFIFSGVYVLDYYINSAKQKGEFDELAQMVESIQAQEPSESKPLFDPDGPGQTLPTGPTEPTEPTMLPEYAPLYDLNPDMVGWIKIEDTRINYPVMQTPDRPDHYLYRNFHQESSAQGCLYAREVCDITTPSDNITIYGHCMNDGSMFEGLHDYVDKSFFLEHGIIRFDTLMEHHEYQIFAVFKTTASIGEGFAYHQFVDAGTQKEFDSFVSVCKNLSFYDTGFTPEYGDKLITLSTCEYSQVNGRLVVVAYRIS
mgnify:CR=1 FL=1